MCASLVLGDAEPAEPLAFVGAGPKRGIALPQAADLVVRFPVVERCFDAARQSVRQLVGLPIRSHACSLRICRVGLQQLVEGVGEQLDAVDQQLVGDFLHGNAGLLERRHGLGGRVDIFGQAGAQLAVIAESVEGGRRNGVDGVRADQLFDVDARRDSLILCAGAGPQQALRLRAFGGERFPSRAAEQLLIFLVGEFGVGDGHFAFEALEQRLLRGSVAVFSFSSIGSRPACRCG